MISRDSIESDEKQGNENSKSSKCWFNSCFSQTSFSDSDSNSDSDYVVINHSVFKIPKNLQAANNGSNLNSAGVGSSTEQRTVIVQRGSEKKVNGGYYKKGNRKNIPERRSSERKANATGRRKESQVDKKDINEKVYQYIRMKTYERMNPYEMTPNDFLNNISSVFVENIKEPVPKDPLNAPRIFNRYCKRKRKTETQIMYEKAKEKEREKFSSAYRSNVKYSNLQSLRKPTINPAVMSDTNKSFEEEPVGYKAAIEQEEKGKEYEEKVLIWKIVVVNDEDETKD